MTIIELQLPESLLNQARDFATRENVSIDQLTATALTEKLAALTGNSHLQERAARGNRQKYLQALSQVPDCAPVPPDELAEIG